MEAAKAGDAKAYTAKRARTNIVKRIVTTVFDWSLTLNVIANTRTHFHSYLTSNFGLIPYRSRHPSLDKFRHV